MTSNVLSEVCDIAADLFAVDARSLTGASSPEQVDTWDSLQHLNLVLALENKYAIQFEPEEMEGMTDLSAIANLVRTKLT